MRALLLLAALAPALPAGIEGFDLPGMVERADGWIVGTIEQREVVRIDHPVDGPELYFTHLTIQGEDLATGAPLTVRVTFPGGFVDARHGVWNSEAPAGDDTRLGARVVAFWKASPNLGGDLAGNGLVASHGGLYRTFDTRRGTVVQGRGARYAVPANVELAVLRERVADLARAKAEKAAREAEAARRAETERPERADAHGSQPR